MSFFVQGINVSILCFTSSGKLTVLENFTTTLDLLLGKYFINFLEANLIYAVYFVVRIEIYICISPLLPFSIETACQPSVEGVILLVTYPKRT